MPSGNRQPVTDEQVRPAVQNGIGEVAGRTLVVGGTLDAVLSLVPVHFSDFALVQVYAVAADGDAGHAVAAAAFLYWVILLAGAVAVFVTLAAAVAGLALAGQSWNTLVERLDAAPRRGSLEAGLVVVAPPVSAYGGTALLGRSAVGAVATLVATSFVGGLLLLASVLTGWNERRTDRY